jgi:DNA-binding transcriptional regulator YdaS (Cro superfamily)
VICVGNRIQMRTVQRATEIAEGVIPLAIYLGVPPATIAAWIQGASEVPPALFLKIVEIVVDHAAPRMRGVIPPSLVETFKHRKAANG